MNNNQLHESLVTESNSGSIATVDLFAAKYNGCVYRIFSNNIFLKDDDDKAIYYSPCGSPFFNVSTQTQCSSACDQFIVIPKKEYYNMVILVKEGGAIEYYINLTLIPEIRSDHSVRFVDMDIDLSFSNHDRLVDELDWDEFERNALIYQYSASDVETIQFTVSRLKALISSSDYYFSDQFVTYCQELKKTLL